MRWITDRLFDRLRDRRHGIDSAKRRSAAELQLASADSVEYQAVSYGEMEELLRLLRPGPADVFLDLGCGMGRAVSLAAMYPMRAVLGVEISGELCAIAKQNICKMAGQLKCHDVRIVEGNAADYAIPREVSIVYLFNPFTGATLRQVLENLALSINETPRRVRVVFYGTLSSESFAAEAGEHSWLKLETRHVLSSGTAVLVYRAFGAA